MRRCFAVRPNAPHECPRHANQHGRGYIHFYTDNDRDWNSNGNTYRYADERPWNTNIHTDVDTDRRNVHTDVDAHRHANVHTDQHANSNDDRRHDSDSEPDGDVGSNQVHRQIVCPRTAGTAGAGWALARGQQPSGLVRL